MKKGRIIILSGPSGVGKGTVLREVMRKHPELQFSVSATTRPIRPSETDGINYYFLSKERFEEMIARDELLEHMSYVGNYYGTPEQPINDAIEKGVSVVLEIDVKGALQVMQRRPDALSVFISPPSYEELERRLYGRGDTAPEIAAERLEIARWECDNAKYYQYIIVNEEIECAAKRLEEILIAEGATYQTNSSEEEK